MAGPIPLSGPLSTQTRRHHGGAGADSGFYGFDLQWTARELLSAGAAVTDAYWQDAFGSEVFASGATVNPYRYVGAFGYRREDATRDDVWHRMLRRDSGRWLGRDPLPLPEGHDPRFAAAREPHYGYVGARPITFLDPRGEGSAPGPSCRRFPPTACFWCMYARLRDARKGRPSNCPEKACNIARVSCGALDFTCGACGPYGDPSLDGARCFDSRLWFGGDGFGAGGPWGDFMRYRCGGSQGGLYAGADKLAHCWTACMIGACEHRCILPVELVQDAWDDISANLLGWECAKEHVPFGNYARECLDCCRGAIYHSVCD